MNLDLSIFQALNGLANYSPFFDVIAIFFAKYLGYILIGVLLFWLSRDIAKNGKPIFLALCTAFITRFVIVEIIRSLWFRSRPFVDMTAHLLLKNYNPTESSFPSGHASFYFALSTVIYCYHRKLGIWLYGASIVMGISRIVVGVHWPSDILAGAVLGIGLGYISFRCYKKYEYRKNN